MCDRVIFILSNTERSVSFKSDTGRESSQDDTSRLVYDPFMPSADTPRRSERSRAAILQATQELIREQPYGKISIEGIAARAKVGKQTIYRWWRSKGALVVDALHEQNAAGAQEAMALPDTGDLAVAFELFMAPMFYRWQSGAHPLTHDHADAVVDLAMRALAP